MCGRISQHYTWKQVEAFAPPLVLAEGHGNLRQHFNIAPTALVDIIVSAGGVHRLTQARWWLVPARWPRALKEVPRTFNARVETVDTAPMFRNAFRRKRCIIPANGFYEWTGKDGNKTPHYISAADGGLLGFAGLWDAWWNAKGEKIISATIIVRPADSFMSRICDHMPCALWPADFDAWLSGKAGKETLTRSPPPLQEWIVSKMVNRAGSVDDDPEAILALSVPVPLAG